MKLESLEIKLIRSSSEKSSSTIASVGELEPDAGEPGAKTFYREPEPLKKYWEPEAVPGSRAFLLAEPEPVK